MAGSEALQGVAALFKRVKNISKGVDAGPSLPAGGDRLVEPAEVALRDAVAAHDAGDSRARPPTATIGGRSPPWRRWGRWWRASSTT